ncbi:hypothetical protein ACJX0J_005674, partial [Zea mays]
NSEFWLTVSLFICAVGAKEILLGGRGFWKYYLPAFDIRKLSIFLLFCDSDMFIRIFSAFKRKQLGMKKGDTMHIAAPSII